MVVDLATCRASIGSFRYLVGVDVATEFCYFNFNDVLRAVGTVAFIGLLLLLAGIEPNPGPRQDGNNLSLTEILKNNKGAIAAMGISVIIYFILWKGLDWVQTLLLAVLLFLTGLLFWLLWSGQLSFSEMTISLFKADPGQLTAERRGNPQCPDELPGAEDVAKWTSINEAKEVKEHFSRYGLKNIRNILQQHLNEWKEKPLNVATIGTSGVGKSSLINALLNIESGKKGAAKVGRTQCTDVCQPYFHREHKNFVVWDLPGVGTKQFPKTSYLEDIKVDTYDFFLIVMSNRFTKKDLWLAYEINKRGKKFYFIRTKVDRDMDEIKRSQEGFNEALEFQKLKFDVCAEVEKDFENKRFSLFLISNHYPNKYDFPFLLHRLLDDIPKEKEKAMVFSLSGLSKTLIEEKASALRSRIWKWALISGSAAAVPVPGLSTSVNVAIILEEILFYRSQFALDDDSLRHLAHMRHISLEELKKEVKFNTPEDVFTRAGLIRYIGKCAMCEVIEKVAYYTMPGIGAGIAFSMSGSATLSILEKILYTMKEDAINILLAVTTKETSIE